MIKLGPIVMGCRRCNAAPGSPCRNFRTAGIGERGVIQTFHKIRESDAARASELLE